MKTRDLLPLAFTSLSANRLRTFLMLIAMGIGVAAVVILTALGEGARRYVMSEFSALGTHLLIVLPGRNETTGGPPPITGVTPRDLTVEDAAALMRNPHIHTVAPVVAGSATLSAAGRTRESLVLGSTAALLSVRNLSVAEGRFLPEIPIHQGQPVAVLGAVLKRELFDTRPAVGQWIRIGDRRFRVVGVLTESGISIGINLDEIAIIPVASAQSLFNTPSLFRILVQARSREDIPAARDGILATIRERHEKEEDITVITQDAVLSTFDTIFSTLTMAVGGIAAVSLVVAGILITNVMLITVSQRRAEIGILMALGARRREVLKLFLTEAFLLSLAGSVGGLAVGFLAVAGATRLYPAFPAHVPAWAAVLAFGVALLTALAFAAWPASQAARINPVRALGGR